MARMNNQDRSLQIIAKQNGWDPTQIIGDVYTIPEDRVTRGDYLDIPESMKASDVPSPTPKVPALNETEVWLKDRTVNADPFPGMPGAR